MKIPQGILALNWGAASGRIKGADILRSCKVLTSKLSFSFVLAPASLLWNYLPALPCKAQPRKGPSVATLGTCSFEKQDPPLQPEQGSDSSWRVVTQAARGRMSATAL